MRHLSFIAACLLSTLALAQDVALRVATFNVEDIRTSDLADAANPRLRALAEVIQRLRPNVILLNEIAYDMPGAPGWREGAKPGQNAARFVELYLSVPQADGLIPIRYTPFMAPVNSGVASGFDLDKDGTVTTSYPNPPPSGPDGSPRPQTAEGQAYGNDCWGFGTFPGQYGMALLVGEPLEIVAAEVRTFQRLPWDYVPGAFLPTDEHGKPWYTPEQLALFRLSSKSHWDVPVKVPNGAVVHFLCSHPTPPAFDGPEMRNRKRNHDEIRFWADYVSNAPYIVDDTGREGGLTPYVNFVILGDLNADPEKGNSWKNPIRTALGSIGRLVLPAAPRADLDVPGLSLTDTAMFKMRVDYVLPCKELAVRASGVYRAVPAARAESRVFPSDHFPVWVDMVVPQPR
ncbi:MAG: endonuclease/exonuclease/phosphatase family protein [Phycisphaerales bacterium]|nr:endonuclease/exonuclease/phosphatase family protein [Phycisphaerales bacterium]